MIPEAVLPGLSRIQVSISGAWLPLPKRDWKGHAACSEPFVGVAILESPASAEWCISVRDDSEVRLAIFPYDQDGLDVEVTFSLGQGGRRWRTWVCSPTYFPVIRSSLVIETGRVVTFCTVEGEPQIELKALFVARRDVKSRRNGVWHIRPELADSLPLPFQVTTQVESETGMG